MAGTWLALGPGLLEDWDGSVHWTLLIHFTSFTSQGIRRKSSASAGLHRAPAASRSSWRSPAARITG